MANGSELHFTDVAAGNGTALQSLRARMLNWMRISDGC